MKNTNSKLSERNKIQIVDMYLYGWNAKEISRLTGLSYRLVNEHIKSSRDEILGEENENDE